MEEKKIKREVIKSFLIILIISIIFHTYYNIYGLSLPALQPISGKAITENIMDNISELENKERLIIISEWFIIIIIVIFILLKKAHSSLSLSKELVSVKKIEHDPQIVKSKSRTDIDVLYDILKEKKSLKLQVAIKRFGVSKETIMRWFEILEEGNLAEIEYPTIGDPEIVLKEQKKEEVKDEKA